MSDKNNTVYGTVYSTIYTTFKLMVVCIPGIG